MADKKDKEEFSKNPWFVNLGSRAIAWTLSILVGASIGPGITSFVQNIDIWKAFGIVYSAVFQAILWFLKLPIPIWLVLIILILIILTLILVSRISEGPAWLLYTKEPYMNWIFKWDWLMNPYGKYEISNIRIICPQCECPLTVRNVDWDKQIYACPQGHGSAFNSVPSEILRSIEVLIIHKVQSNTYPGGPNDPAMIKQSEPKKKTGKVTRN